MTELKTFSLGADSTLYMTCVTALNILLAAYSGQSDIVIGTSVANRQQKILENLIGFFVNTLPIRSQVNPDMTVEQLLKQVKHNSLQAFNHQAVPFDKMVEQLCPHRDQSYSPIFQVLFVLQNAPQELWQVQGLDISSRPVERSGEGVSKFDLFFNIEEHAQGAELSIQYSTDLFVAETVEQMLQDLQHILKMMAAQPDIEVNKLMPPLPLAKQVPALEFHHLGIACDDIEHSIKLVSEMFNIESQSKIVWDEKQQANLCMFEAAEGMRIELVQGAQVDSLRSRDIGFYHVCYQTENLNSAIQYFEKLGAKLISKPTPAVLFEGQLVAFLDTDAGLVELLEINAQIPDTASIPVSKKVVKQASELQFYGYGAVVNQVQQANWQSNRIFGWSIQEEHQQDQGVGGKLSVLASADNMKIQLFEKAQWHAANGIKLSHFSFVVQDMVLAVQHFARLGCEVAQAAQPSQLYDSALVVVLTSPLGQIMLIENENKAVTAQRLEVLGPQIQPQEVLPVVLSGTYTLEPLADTLSFLADKLGCPLNLNFAPYNQCFQQLLDSRSETHLNEGGCNVFLVRFEDWLGQDRLLSSLQKNSEAFITALLACCQQHSGQFIVQICPLSPQSVADEKMLAVCQSIEFNWQTLAKNSDNLTICTRQVLGLRYPVDDYYESNPELVATKPYTDKQYTALASNIFRAMFATLNPAVKVIILDCDNTLWQGICGEVGPHGIKVTAEFKMLQQFMLEQYQRGVLLCLCSKNNPQDVAAVFEQQPDMVLQMKHIVAAKVNWQAKSDNIKALATELNLSLDSMVFIDDDDVQCAEVKAHCPAVLTLQVPKRTQSIPHFLQHIWSLDEKPGETDGLQRTEFYQQNQQRKNLQQSHQSLGSFIEGLALNIKVERLMPQDLARASELSLRTNQFNFTTRRYYENDIKQYLNNRQKSAWIVTVSDRFGDYGQVGLMFGQINQRYLTLTDFMLSCRAMGRGVEYAMIRALAEYAYNNDCTDIELQFVASSRNLPAKQFLTLILGAEPAELNHTITAKNLLVVDVAKAVCLQTEQNLVANESQEKGQDEGNLENVQQQAPKVKYQKETSLYANTLEEISTLNQVDKIYAYTNQYLADNKNNNIQTSVYQAPQSDLEKQICTIYADVLGVPKVGLNDNFFAVGGDSLLVLKLVSRLKKFGFQFSVNDFFRYQSIAELLNADAQDSHLQNGAENNTPQQNNQQTLIVGEVPLSASQHWFLDNIKVQPSWGYVGSILDFENQIDDKLLQQAFYQVLAHHDALRACFTHTENGWQQTYLPVEQVQVAFKSFDLAALSTVEQISAIEKSVVESTQGSSPREADNAAKQPLLSQALIHIDVYNLGENGSVIGWGIHHLLTDGYSTDVVMEDLFNCYQALVQGQTYRLPEKTMSVPAWLDLLSQYVNGPEMNSEIEYWRTLPWQGVAAIPSDIATDKQKNTLDTETTVTAVLPHKYTQYLLENAVARLGTTFVNVLIAAVTQSVSEFAKGDWLSMKVIDSGRNLALQDNVDLSRTVGWLSIDRLLMLQAQPHELDMVSTFSAIDKQIASLPNQGSGYSLLKCYHQNSQVQQVMGDIPKPNITLNYAGKAEEQAQNISPLRQQLDSIGAGSTWAHPDNERDVQFFCIANIVQEELVIEWKYGQQMYSQSLMSEVVNTVVNKLVLLVDALQKTRPVETD
nr:HAD-IIIC family phosphatase [Catenovulum sediminis]